MRLVEKREKCQRPLLTITIYGGGPLENIHLIIVHLSRANPESAFLLAKGSRSSDALRAAERVPYAAIFPNLANFSL
jgi:hypothetical protein